MDLQNFVSQLRERGVYQVAGVYAAAAWALLQVADVVFPIVGLPDEAITFLLVAAAGFFPVALILSWVLDWTPAGLRVTSAQQLPAPTGSSRRWLVEFVVLVFLVGLVGYLYWERLALTEVISKVETSLQEKRHTSSAEIPDQSIAVLPFATMSERAEDGYFGDGLAEEILNLLARLNELQVAARTTSFAFRGENADIREMARAMNVRHILEGSVRRSGDQIRVTAQLIDATSGYHLWSQTYDRRFEDIFQIQDDIAQQVTTALQLILSQDQAQRLRVRPTANLESYDYYLRAKDYLRRPAEEATLDSALALLERSMTLDPEFANARAASCTAYLKYYVLKRSSDYFREAERACNAALVLDDRDAEVYAALGNLYLTSGQYEMAAAQFRRSVTLQPGNMDARLGLIDTDIISDRFEQAEKALLTLQETHPNLWRVHYRMGTLLFKSGRAAQSIPSFERVIELSPDNQRAFNSLGAAHFLRGEYKLAAQAWSRSLSLVPMAITYANTGSSFYYSGDYLKAAEMYRKAVELAPQDYEHWGALGDSLHAAQRQDEAVASYLRAIELAREGLSINDDNPDILALLAHYHAAAGQAEPAEKLAQRALQLAPNDMYTHYDAAIAYVWLMQEQRAVELIVRALELGYPARLLAADPPFIPLAGEIEQRRLEQTP